MIHQQKVGNATFPISNVENVGNSIGKLNIIVLYLKVHCTSVSTDVKVYKDIHVHSVKCSEPLSTKQLFLNFQQNFQLFPHWKLET